MPNKAKHAFGTLERIDEALSSGAINAYDILFVKDENGKPYVGWIDKDGNKVIVEEDLSGLEAEIAKKIDANEVDVKIENALNEHMYKKYEITNTPEGTLVDYRDKEIRVMCPADTKWVKQSVGATGNANMYYMGFKAYAPEGAVSFKEGDRGIIVDEMFTFDDDFAGTDEYGRNYSICWFALASYDSNTDTWTYFGKNSSAEKYIGWDYVVEWYNADGIVIASDCVRVNLSNENCHSSTQPYYIGGMKKEIEIMVDEKIAGISAEIPTYEIVEF